ncbi:DegT/DnrJ/EryC1/StrS family aminotransferase [Rhodocytophaga aerolata]|uniref:DegT/DnrJ/EryC1/StrS family aminotransferase n=1 Tax=Rhodocytophaga aerolata TaxID=455078 RepID=A0ABT8REI7_9BACT|nr:DegT/DnrJ/EryC1/StrS family aminotransferase [Rhodocytophaga aerolata]MDO1449754.1 DegT/DnrJ/EryC1/StrS family aminotransferase [Rhodocytophaga aerolata]
MIPIARPYVTQEDAQAAYDTILSGWITQGPKVEAFEEKFAAYTGAKYAVAVSCCTAALHLSLIVAGIGPGDEVICPSMSYIATANAIRYVGALPVFAEVDAASFNLSLMDVQKRITARTKAILLVHQLGMPADIDSFQALCAKHGLVLIEDAACAAGSAYKGKKIGSHSQLVCFSFHPRKVLSTGDGGMITTSQEEYYLRLKRLRQHGMSVSDRVRHQASHLVFEDHTELGYNYRLTDIQAAIGIGQLEKLDWMIAERRKIASCYQEAFQEIACLQLPREEAGYYSNYQSYALSLGADCPLSRNDIMQQLLDKGIASRRGVMTAHRETAYGDYYPDLHLPISEKASDQSLILPLFVGMSNEEIGQVIEAIKQILSGPL